MFSSTGSLVTSRHWYTASLLPDGKVLVIGGAGESGELASTEAYRWW